MPFEPVGLSFTISRWMEWEPDDDRIDLVTDWAENVICADPFNVPDAEEVVLNDSLFRAFTSGVPHAAVTLAFMVFDNTDPGRVCFNTLKDELRGWEFAVDT